MILGRYTGQPSLISQPHLCEECNKTQATKIQELNSFEPTKEVSFLKYNFHTFRWSMQYKSLDDSETTQTEPLGKKLISGHGGGCSVDCNTAKT